MITTSLKAQMSEVIRKCEVDSINGEAIHTSSEVAPEYEGGFDKFYKDLSSKIKFKGKNNVGCIKVIISFVVGVDGNMENICLSDNVEMSEGAIKTINNWTAGQIGGNKVPVRLYLPIYIKLG